MAAVFEDWQTPRQAWRQAGADPYQVADVAGPPQVAYAAVEMPDKSQVDLVLGAPGPRRSAPDYLATSLANTILGVFGMMGRIGRVVRERDAIAYHVSSHLAGSLGPAPWTIVAGLAPENLVQGIAGIRSEICRLQDEFVADDELADNIAFRVGSLPISLETNSGLAAAICDMELYELELDYLQRYPALMRALTAEDVQQAARKYLRPDWLAVAAAGPMHRESTESPETFVA
jgi:zinc protease